MKGILPAMPAARDWRSARVVPLAVLTLVATVLLSACTGGSENASQSTTSTESASQPTTSTKSASQPTTNAPWYPSLQAFEHYSSARPHVFSTARFGGSLQGPNTVRLFPSRKGAYPSGYNMSYLDAGAAFIQGGSYGDVENSIGPYVAKVDPKTLKPVWYTQLRNTVQAGEWDYPGGMAIMRDGYIYVVSGYRVYKVYPANGNVVTTLELPTKVYMQTNYPNTPPTYASTLTENAVNTS